QSPGRAGSLALVYILPRQNHCVCDLSYELLKRPYHILSLRACQEKGVAKYIQLDCFSRKPDRAGLTARIAPVAELSAKGTRGTEDGLGSRAPGSTLKVGKGGDLLVDAAVVRRDDDEVGIMLRQLVDANDTAAHLLRVFVD